jgi:molybdopterin-guanine dinucleotide biosynthesis protein MobB
VIGKKEAGKTTLIVALASEFVRKGRRVMTIKQAPRGASVEVPGSDSYIHFHEGKVERTLLVSPELRMLLERHANDTDPVALSRRYFDGADIVLCEGFQEAAIPKIEVFRRAANPAPLYAPSLPDVNRWIAIVTDDDKFEAHCPVLRFHDTMWLQLLANMGWEKALLI